MSTAITHPHRTPKIAAGAAAAALAVAGSALLLGAFHDSSPTSDVAPAGTSELQFQLTGPSFQHGTWDFAGTTSGGRPQLGL
jgi:hypothetical protein